MLKKSPIVSVVPLICAANNRVMDAVINEIGKVYSVECTDIPKHKVPLLKQAAQQWVPIGPPIPLLLKTRDRQA
jgi:hypothetical protein